MTRQDRFVAQLTLLTLLSVGLPSAASAQSAAPQTPSMPAALTQAAGPTTLSGTYSSTIVDWPQGQTGKVSLVRGSTTLVSGDIDAQGRFSLTLPDIPKADPALPTVKNLFAPKTNYDTGCTGQGTAAPSTAHYKEFDLKASIGSGAPIDLKLMSDTHLPYPLEQGYSELTYFDVPTTLDGSVTCKTYVATFKGTFPAGWSLPSGVVTNISSDLVYTDAETPAPLPEGVTWHLYNILEGIGIQMGTALVGPPGVNVTQVTAGQPADKAGVQLNDLLVQIDGQDVTRMPLSQVYSLIRGPAGTVVTLGVVRGSDPAVRQIKVTRARLLLP